MGFEDVLERALAAALQADRTGVCPHCGSPIIRSFDPFDISWACTKCVWVAGMSTGLYDELVSDEGR